MDSGQEVNQHVNVSQLCWVCLVTCFACQCKLPGPLTVHRLQQHWQKQFVFPYSVLPCYEMGKLHFEGITGRFVALLTRFDRMTCLCNSGIVLEGFKADLSTKKDSGWEGAIMSAQVYCVGSIFLWIW